MDDVTGLDQPAPRDMAFRLLAALDSEVSTTVDLSPVDTYNRDVIHELARIAFVAIVWLSDEEDTPRSEIIADIEERLDKIDSHDPDELENA